MTFVSAIVSDREGRHHLGKGNASCHIKNIVLGQVDRVKNIEVFISIYKIIFFSLFM